MTTGVLTEELLAMAERLYRMTLTRGAGVYYVEDGIIADFERERSAEEKTNWLT